MIHVIFYLALAVLAVAVGSIAWERGSAPHYDQDGPNCDEDR